jgi:uncharacterized protein (TIGR03086 family)
MTNNSSTLTDNTTDNHTTTGRRHLPIEHTDGSPLAADDPRVPVARSVHTIAVVVDELTADNATDPTQCPDWNAHAMAGHIVAVLDRIAALPDGNPIDQMPIVRDDDSVADMPTVIADAARRVEAAWTDEALDRMVIVPWAAIPGAVAMQVYSSELLVHAWDLATAIGVEPQWHQPDVEAALEVARTGIPAEPRDPEEMPFGAVVPTAADAPAIDRLVAWMGRTPV